MPHRIPGYALDLICDCGREVTLFEDAEGASWIESITRQDLQRFRCKSCGRHPSDMRRRWQTVVEWRSSN